MGRDKTLLFLYTYNGVTCITMRTDRPWGWYETIEEGHRYKVKNIEIKPEREYLNSFIIIDLSIGLL